MNNEQFLEIESLIKRVVSDFYKRNNMSYGYFDLYNYAIFEVCKFYDDYDSTKSKITTYIQNQLEYRLYNYIRDNIKQIEKDKNLVFVCDDDLNHNSLNDDIDKILDINEIYSIREVLDKKNRLKFDLIYESIKNENKIKDFELLFLKNIRVLLKK